MSSLTGIWQGGQVVPDGIADWPDGCRVVVEPLTLEDPIGLSEEQWRDSPEDIAEWIQWYESLEPLEITPEEHADAALWRQQLRAYERSRRDERLKELFK